MSTVQPIIDHDFLEEDHLPYHLLGSLGHGASGTVEKVMDLRSHKVYARKTIRITGTGYSKEQKRATFQNEVDILRGLERHCHIIRVHATYYTKRNFGILLDPVASDRDLEDFIEEYYGAVENGAVAKLAAMTSVMEQAFGCLAAGLAFMHQRRVRHKDIKLRNILVHNGRMLYTDFGYSFDSNGFTHSATGGIAEHFTRRYSCPEVLDEQERNSNSDVFSLGCVFIDIFSALARLGVPIPEEGQCFANNIEHLQQQVLSTEVSTELEHLPRIIIRMTKRNSEDRLCSAHSAAELLQTPLNRCVECASSPVDEWIARCRNKGCSIETAHTPSATFQEPAHLSSATDQQIAPVLNYGSQTEDRVVTGPYNAPARNPGRIELSASLDSWYFTRKGDEASEFFQQGRVFSKKVVAEDSSHRPLDTSKSENSPLYQLKGRSTMQSSHQRLVIVKVYKANRYVLACEITAYNNRGTLDPDCIPSKHAIAYVRGTQPVYLDGEREKGMIKEPIEIDLVDQSIRYEPSSRLNFGKVINVDFSTEVHYHGFVIQDHMSRLIGYYRSEHQEGLGRNDE